MIDTCTNSFIILNVVPSLLDSIVKQLYKIYLFLLRTIRAY